MFLKEIENAEPSPESGRYGRVIAHCRAEDRPVPQIYHLFAQRPDAAGPLSEFMEAVMRGPSDLTAGQRELIASLTSAWNNCLF